MTGTSNFNLLDVPKVKPLVPTVTSGNMIGLAGTIVAILLTLFVLSAWAVHEC